MFKFLLLLTTLFLLSWNVTFNTDRMGLPSIHVTTSASKPALASASIKVSMRDERIKQLKNDSNFKQQLNCLAKNIFYEARGTSEDEKIRVVNVTLNRVKSNRFDSTICGVVYRYKQFSWTLDRKKKYTPVHVLYSNNPAELKAWKKSQEIAYIALTTGYKDKTNGALFYHTHYVSPKWNKRAIVSMSSYWHVFYTATAK